jgi:ATP-dependent protease Clp ATPase subunit
MKLSLTCSFCGRTDEQVQRLIAGPKVFICDRCVATCNTILAKHPPGDTPIMSATVQVHRPRRWWQSFVEWWSATASQVRVLQPLA